jgi:hypothetical protein
MGGSRRAWRVIVCAAAFAIAGAHAEAQSAGRRPPHTQLFQSSDQCLACHNNLITPTGVDVSIAADWRASMMAHSARDPYWQAGVRRETIDHASAREQIEDECSICHMPMARTQAKSEGRAGRVFAHLPVGGSGDEESRLAGDGVSCAVCHQISNAKLGTSASFTGGFEIDTTKPLEERSVFGRFRIDEGRTIVMRSATGFVPTQATHISSSELCATCHTLITEALGPDGRVVGRLPEQVMYLEWRHSAFREARTCQSCHMPVVQEPTPIASVLGEPRTGVGRHVFVGGNFFMLRLLNRYRASLGVVAPPRELDAAAERTVQFLQTVTATVGIADANVLDGRVQFAVNVVNLTGHKFPTGYPSRRAWLHVTVRDASRRTVFESGAVTASGAITGNDNDADARRFEPHYLQVQRPDQVQIYESIMTDPAGAVTTGLLTASRYAKDNRLLPQGFNKTTAEADIAVIGGAREDADFGERGDRVGYAVDAASAAGPFTVDVELRFQSIGFRWAENLRAYRAVETDRFVGFYESMSAASSEVIARASAIVR